MRHLANAFFLSPIQNVTTQIQIVIPPRRVELGQSRWREETIWTGRKEADNGRRGNSLEEG